LSKSSRELRKSLHKAAIPATTNAPTATEQRYLLGLANDDRSTDWVAHQLSPNHPLEDVALCQLGEERLWARACSTLQASLRSCRQPLSNCSFVNPGDIGDIGNRSSFLDQSDGVLLLLDRVRRHLGNFEIISCSKPLKEYAQPVRFPAYVFPPTGLKLVCKGFVLSFILANKRQEYQIRRAQWTIRRRP
jgi:hypothetical protein